MSSTAAPAALHLQPLPSRRLRLALAAAHAGAIGLLLLLPLALHWQLLLIGVVGLSGYWYWRRSTQLPLLVWEADGEWLWQLPGGATERLVLQPDTFVSRWLVVLCFRNDSGARRTLPLLPDSLAPAPLRRLRVRLRLEGAKASQPADP